MALKTTKMSIKIDHVGAQKGAYQQAAKNPFTKQSNFIFFFKFSNII